MGLTSQTKVGDLDGISRRSGRRGDEIRVAAKGRVAGSGCRDQDVLRLDVAMEEVMGVDVVQPREDLIENAFDVSLVETLLVPRLHQLVQVTVHVLHADVKFPRKGVEEDVQSRSKMGVVGKGAEEDDFAQVKTGTQRIESLLHRFNGDLLEGVKRCILDTQRGERRLTIVPLRAMLEPAVRTRATATLPKLPSPISLMTSNRSSRVAIDVGA